MLFEGERGKLLLAILNHTVLQNGFYKPFTVKCIYLVPTFTGNAVSCKSFFASTVV